MGVWWSGADRGACGTAVVKLGTHLTLPASRFLVLDELVGVLWAHPTKVRRSLFWLFTSVNEYIDCKMCSNYSAISASVSDRRQQKQWTIGNEFLPGKP